MTAEQAATPSSPRLARRRDRKIQTILDVTAEVLQEKGYERLALDDIAEKLDVSKGSLYYYFKGKDELVSACMQALGDRATEMLASAAESLTGTPTERLHGLILEQLSIVRKYPQTVSVLLHRKDWPDLLAERATDLRRRHGQYFRDVIREGVESGEFITDPQAAVANLEAAMAVVPAVPRTEESFLELRERLTDNLMRLFVPAHQSAGPPPAKE